MTLEESGGPSSDTPADHQVALHSPLREGSPGQQHQHHLQVCRNADPRALGLLSQKPEVGSAARVLTSPPGDPVPGLSRRILC